MKGKKMFLYLSVLLAIGLIFSVRMVEADNDSNDYVTEAETLSEGTHSGTLGEGDHNDWYKFEVHGKETVRVEGVLKDAGWDDAVYATSTDSNGLPDNQVNIETYKDFSKDHCHWTNYEETSRYMYIQVHGYGTYELTIEMEDDSETEDLFNEYCCIMSIIPVTIVLILLVGISIHIKRR